MEFGALTPATFANIGGWAAFVFVLLTVSRMVYVGKLVPQSTHERELNAVTKDRDDWRAAAEAKDGTIGVLTESHRDVADSLQVVEQFVRSLPQPPRQSSRGGR